MSYSAHEINKAVEDAISTMTNLDKAISSSRGSEVEYLPTETTQKAYDALEKLKGMLKAGGEGAKELKGRGNVLDVMDKLGPKLDRVEIQTMLGTMAVELSGMLRAVQQVLAGSRKGQKVEGTGFERLK